MTILSINNFPYDYLNTIPVLTKGRGKNTREYLDIITAFDIETTNLDEIEQSIMYIWQFQVGLEYTVIGRTWEEYFSFLNRIREIIKDRILVIYVHNLSFEWTFLKGLYYFPPEDVFATDSYKILKCSMFNCFEYRCSYYLTNMSLGSFTKKMKVENLKLSGLEFNYNKKRYPWTPLTDQELAYCINDVKGLVQALYRYFAIEKDNIVTTPLTATGYPRRDCKKAMQNYNHKQLKAMLPDPDVYRMLRAAYRGGNTHANRWHSDRLLENVTSYDIVSSYPAVMLTCEYPMKPFSRVYDTSLENARRYLDGHVPMLFRISFRNIRLHNIMTGAPYLSSDKCADLIEPEKDNGRILRADYLTTTITDIDFRIILEQYDWDACSIYDLYVSSYEPLPLQFREVIQKYYNIKTELKGSPEGSDDYLYMTVNKAKLNSCYGMTAQDPVKDTLEYIDGKEEPFTPQDKPLEELLEKSNKSAFMSYAWGVWVTCHARARLQKAIDLAGNNFVYCDTDSVKCLGDQDLTEYNAWLKEQAERAGAYALDNKGVVHYIGVFEYEGRYDQFKTLGAKKYVYTQDGKLHITIAGVNKKLGAEELGTIDNFKEGFIFKKAGGTESIYNNNIDFYINVDGHQLEITDNVYIKDSTYTLGITAEYQAILDGLVEIKYADHEIPGLYHIKK